MTDTPTDTGQPDSLTKVVTALAELGQATAAAIATKAGIGYSTTTPKLRALEQANRAERLRTGSGTTLWQLTESQDTDTGQEDTDATNQAEEPAPEPDATPAGDDRPDQDPTGQDTAHQASTTGQDLETPVDGDPDIDPEVEPTAADGLSPSAVDTCGRAEASESTDEPLPAVTDTETDESEQPQPDREPEQPSAPTEPEAAPAPAPETTKRHDSKRVRRTGGSLRGAILDILEANPDRQYKTGELCRLIDQANEGTGAAKASPGAVANALFKLAAASTVIQTVERPATFQLAPRP
jgi:hypothetical protein